MFADRKQNPPEVCFPQNTRHFHKISRTSIFLFLLKNFDLSKYLGTFTLHVDESGEAIANNDAAIFISTNSKPKLYVYRYCLCNPNIQMNILCFFLFCASN